MSAADSVWGWSAREAAPEARSPRARRARLVALAQALAVLVLMVASGWAGHVYSERRGQEALRLETRHKLDLFAAAVQGVVRRLEHVPGTIQLNPDVLALLRQPADAGMAARVQAYLQRLNAHVGSHRVAVLDERGTVLAASHGGAAARGLLSADLSFSPFFLEALAGRVGRHFAIGVPEGEPGYFVSHPIHDGSRVVGVAMIQIGLAAIEDTWSMLGAPALVADGQRVVILSSEPAWRYTALAPLSDEQRVDIELARLYGGRSIAPFPLALPPSLRVEGMDQEGLMTLPASGAEPGDALRDKAVLAMSRPLDGMDWRVLVFADYKPVRTQSWNQALLAALAAGSAGLLLVLLQQRRRILRQKLEARRLLEEANADLEGQVVRRTTALREANERLRDEVREREQAESHLRETQAELVHAAKMAVLGQLSTSITHELAQPLGGIRTLSGNAAEFLRRGQTDAVAQNLAHVARLADQMGEIIQPLKGYARKSAPRAEAVDLAQALSSARWLFEPRLKREQVQVVDRTTPGQVTAWCDANRLQQVLVNLLANALDALEGAPTRELCFSAGEGDPPMGALDAQQAQDAPHGAAAAAAETPAAETPGAASGGVSGPPRQPGPWVWLQVEDSGPGLTPAQLEHLFEPFFTTKAPGSGLGLGLAVSRDIVREFGGEITAGNRPEGGARFLVRMPSQPDESSSQPVSADHAS